MPTQTAYLPEHEAAEIRSVTGPDGGMLVVLAIPTAGTITLTPTAAGRLAVRTWLAGKVAAHEREGGIACHSVTPAGELAAADDSLKVNAYRTPDGKPAVAIEAPRLAELRTSPQGAARLACRIFTAARAAAAGVACERFTVNPGDLELFARIIEDAGGEMEVKP